LNADKLKYSRAENLIDATGNVAVTDDSLRASMSGQTAVFNDSTRYGLIIGNPVLMREDDEGRKMSITCKDTIEVLRSENIARLWSNVVMTRDSLRATSGRAEYLGDAEEVVLMDYQLMEYLSVNEREDDRIMLTTASIVRGDTIRIYLKDNEFAGAEITGNVSGEITAVDSTGALYDRTIIECRTMLVQMNGDVISLISAAGWRRAIITVVLWDRHACLSMSLPEIR
jgi:lipopolysaccharide export system protein LptA